MKLTEPLCVLDRDRCHWPKLYSSVQQLLKQWCNLYRAPWELTLSLSSILKFGLGSLSLEGLAA
jgi:hypothetical protein